jgi:hypothetical protein
VDHRRTSLGAGLVLFMRAAASFTARTIRG